jgi:hypothetical protein
MGAEPKDLNVIITGWFKLLEVVSLLLLLLSHFPLYSTSFKFAAVELKDAFELINASFRC